MNDIKKQRLDGQAVFARHEIAVDMFLLVSVNSTSQGVDERFYFGAELSQLIVVQLFLRYLFV